MAPRKSKVAEPSAGEYLSKSCPLLRRTVAAAGPFVLPERAPHEPYEALVRAISHQQLHGKAAEAILARFIALYPAGRFPLPGEILATPIETLRAVGFSQSKVRAICDVAEKAVAGVVPSAATIGQLGDDEIIERLTEVRGVGRWTVEMLLIFQLRRPDVLPADDYGVRNGFRILRGDEELPKPRELRSYGERWAPHRTAAAWYLWRTVDLAKAAAR